MQNEIDGLRELLARQHMAEVTHRYMRGLDRIDRTMLLSAFHDDAFVDVGLFQGNPEEFADFALDLLSTMYRTHHMLGQQRIEFRSDTHASGECYFQAYHDVTDEAGQKRDLFVSGRYIDEYSCRNGDWKIAARRLITDWVTDNPGSREFFDTNPGPWPGKRDGQDFSDKRDWPDAVRSKL